LNISAGTISPVFIPYAQIFDYTVHVDASTEKINITGITDIPGATVTGNVTDLLLTLNDYTLVTITVTLQNGESQKYSIIVIRGDISGVVSFTWKIDNDGQEISNFIGALQDENLWIDWGDGTQTDEITGFSKRLAWWYTPHVAYGNWITHTYSVAGTYKVTIFGENGKINPLLTLFPNLNEADHYKHPMNYVHLTQIDVNNALNLRSLWTQKGEINQLDLSRNPKLELISCEEYRIKELDLTNKTDLVRLVFSNNQLTILDTGNNRKLSELICVNNSIPLINLYTLVLL